MALDRHGEAYALPHADRPRGEPAPARSSGLRAGARHRLGRRPASPVRAGDVRVPRRLHLARSTVADHALGARRARGRRLRRRSGARRSSRRGREASEPALVDGASTGRRAGPRLETPAEIRHIARDADVIGMTIGVGVHGRGRAGARLRGDLRRRQLRERRRRRGAEPRRSCARARRATRAQLAVALDCRAARPGLIRASTTVRWAIARQADDHDQRPQDGRVEAPPVAGADGAADDRARGDQAPPRPSRPRSRRRRSAPAVRLTSPASTFLSPLRRCSVSRARSRGCPSAGCPGPRRSSRRRRRWRRSRRAAPTALLVALGPVGEPAVDRRLRDDQHERDRDQGGDDRVERGGGQDQQQSRADDRRRGPRTRPGRSTRLRWPSSSRR